MRYVILGLTVLFLVGCAQKIQTDVVLKNQAITKTQKAEIIEDEKRFLVVGTYLNDIIHEATPPNTHEHFIIALYEGGENPYRAPILGAQVNDVNATWEYLEHNSPLLELLPMANSWSHYYHIKAPLSYPDKLILQIEIDPLRQVRLNFEKDPR
ncbi:hypothetical protein JWV37_08040 [Sulfurospirillum sp. T05]|uniref:Lipoprotein n=1 Tax=Sulfurospirillum tamanense TaxID=2813362 RepID=A0ABS2WST4_9BACT|nr:hypothetical protein [Sulfurospirillum tamanensis]MBN2964728.1 hypothetical protein [Sulfurospirillum tamanensis]